MVSQFIYTVCRFKVAPKQLFLQQMFVGQQLNVDNKNKELKSKTAWRGICYTSAALSQHFCRFPSKILEAPSTRVKPQTTTDAEQILVSATVPQREAAHCSFLSGLSLGRNVSASTGVQTVKKTW